MPTQQPLHVFISYSNNELDRPMLNKIRGYLHPLENKSKIKVWDDSHIEPGANWDDEVKENLEKSELVILLLSPEFFKSYYINHVELDILFRNEQENKCVIVPILLRRCMWDEDERIAEKAILPKEEHSQKLKAIDEWEKESVALGVIGKQLREKIEQLSQKTRVVTIVKTPVALDKPLISQWHQFFSRSKFTPKSIVLKNSVDCDRLPHYRDHLQKHFILNWKKEVNLIYFISGCPTQKPGSLARRLIYSRPDEFTRYFENEHHEVEIVDFQVNNTPQKTWESFYTLLQSRVLMQDITFEKFINNPAPFLRKEHRIALTFRIDEQNWVEVDDIHEHIRFIINKLGQIPQKFQKFVLFFIFRFHEIHDTRKNKCQYTLNLIESLIQPGDIHKEEYHIVHIPKLPYVKEQDIKTWAYSIVDPDDVEPLIDELQTQLPSLKKTKAEKEKLYDMKAIEEMQYAAYQFKRDANFKSK